MTTLLELKDIFDEYNTRTTVRLSEIKLLTKQLNELKDKAQSKTDICVKMCNSILLDIAQTVSTEFPNDKMLGTYASVINNMIKLKPLEPISNFLIHVYKNDDYRKNILAGNDNFFLANNHSKILNGDDNKISMMFQFKSCWKDMDSDLKEYIKKTMITLVRVAEQYIISKGDIIDINQILATLKEKFIMRSN